MKRHQPRSSHRVGGSVTMSRVRDRTGEDEEAFAIAWHSNGGDLRWLSPKIHSEEAAETALDILASFASATKR
jgi:hypothetical protein